MAHEEFLRFWSASYCLRAGPNRFSIRRSSQRSGHPWYQPSDTFKDEDLSGADKQNVETIVAYENKIHHELGRQPISRGLLEGLFIEDAVKMRQDIYARRGKIFTKEPWFQTYFESFPWYKANPEFAEAQLTEVEKRNIATIAAYEKKAVSAMSVIEG